MPFSFLVYLCSYVIEMMRCFNYIPKKQTLTGTVNVLDAIQIKGNKNDYDSGG